MPRTAAAMVAREAEPFRLNSKKNTLAGNVSVGQSGEEPRCGLDDAKLHCGEWCIATISSWECKGSSWWHEQKSRHLHDPRTRSAHGPRCRFEVCTPVVYLCVCMYILRTHVHGGNACTESAKCIVVECCGAGRWRISITTKRKSILSVVLEAG